MPQKIAPALLTEAANVSASVDLQLEVLRGNGVDDRQRRRTIVDDGDVAAFGQGRANVVGPRRNGEELVAGGTDRIGDRLVGRDQPCQSVGTVLGLHHEIDGGVAGIGGVVGDDDDFGRSGESRGDAHVAGHHSFGQGDVELPGPAMTSTGAIDSVP